MLKSVLEPALRIFNSLFSSCFFSNIFYVCLVVNPKVYLIKTVVGHYTSTQCYQEILFIKLYLWSVFNETDDLCEACIVMCEYCCGKRPVQSWFIVLTLWTTAIASFVYCKYMFIASIYTACSIIHVLLSFRHFIHVILPHLKGTLMPISVIHPAFMPSGI